MTPAMSAAERGLFESFARCSESYVEFGTGGSTCLASRLVGRSILSVDSAKDWLDRVDAACAGSPVRPRLIHADIGVTGEWGYPAEHARAHDWPRYHEALWALPGASDADLYFVDGRFRVACFAQIVARARPDALIAFHDYASRPHYHCVETIARPVATAEDLSVFAPLPAARETAQSMALRHRFETA